MSTTPLVKLKLPLRVHNTLVNARIVTIEDLSEYSTSALEEVRGIGPGSLQIIRKALTRWHRMPTGPEGGETQPAAVWGDDVKAAEGDPGPLSLYEPEPASLWEALERGMKRLRARDLGAFRMRSGCDGRAFILEEVGKRLGVTRERARQLERRARADLVSDSDWPQQLRSRVEHLLRHRKEPLYLDLIAAEDAWFDGFHDHQVFLAGLLEDYGPTGVSVWRQRGRFIVTNVSANVWSRMMRTALDSLTVQVESHLTEAEVRIAVGAIASANNAAELEGLLMRGIWGQLHFAAFGPTGKRHLIAVGRSQANIVKSILMEAAEPLSLEVIGDEFKRRTGAHASTTKLQSLVWQADAVPFASRKYGCTRHIPLTDEQQDEVREVAEEILAETGQARQWHAQEIAEEVVERRPDLPEAVDAYCVNFLLHGSDQVDDLGRLVWVARGKRRATTDDRLEIAASCVAELVRAGRPLSTKELREAVARRRGLREHIQIWPEGKLVRLERGLWGLLDRDVTLSRGKQQAFLQMLRRYIHDQGHAVHATELGLLCAGYPGLAPAVAWGLAEKDERFRAGRGQYLGLSEWEGMRRLTVREAVTQIMERAARGVQEDRIVSEVCRLAKRTISREEVRNVLWNNGYRFKSEAKKWIAGEGEEL